MLSLSAGSFNAEFLHLEYLKKESIISHAMQVFTARSKNIQRDLEQVVLNKFVLSCSVCLVDGTKIRCTRQFRPGFLGSV